MTGKVLFVQYTNPAGYPPLEHSSRILANEGWQVLFLGTGSLGANELRFPLHERIQVRQMPFSPAGWRQKVHYIVFTLWVFCHVAFWRPQWIYASDHLVAPLAYLLSWWPTGKIIYHEHDSPQPDQKGIFQKISLAARRRLASRAYFCILPNQKRLEIFRQVTNAKSPLFCVWNCPRQEEIAEPRAAVSKDIWVLYHGSINPFRLPSTVIRALSKLPENVKLRVVGYETQGHRGYVDELKSLAQVLGIGARLECINAVPTRQDLLALCRACDIGLAFMPLISDDLNMQAMTGASNKPFDYLACGLSLLVSDLPEWRAMYVDEGFGLSCDPGSVNSIAEALLWFYEHPVEMRSMGEKGRQKVVTEWNYENQFIPVLRQLECLSKVGVI